jgi:phosphopantetheinyl transferase (holo-ACP synthase)
MVGNDVVDLDDPESDPRSLQPRYDLRVFTPEERVAIAQSRDPRFLRWQLWAAKEAAYKLARRRSDRVIFSPRRFRVWAWPATSQASGSPRALRAGEARGVVHYFQDSFRVTFVANGAALHAIAIAAGEAPTRLLHGLRKLEPSDGDDPAAPGRAARSLAVAALAEPLGVEPDELRVHKDPRSRIPRLFLRERPAPVDLSLSHHGEWVAFACALESASAERAQAVV